MANTKITVSILQRHLAMIDHWCVTMRLQHGAVISRSAVIRALLDLHEQKCLKGQRK